MVIVLAIFSANASICKRLCLSYQAYTKIRNGNSRKLSLSLGKAFIPPAIHCQYSVRGFCVLTHFYPLEFIFHTCSHFEDVSPIEQDAGLFPSKMSKTAISFILHPSNHKFRAVLLRQTQIFLIYEIRAACTRLWYVMAGIPETLDM